MFSLPRS
jgi:hypothetical protein